MGDVLKSLESSGGYAILLGVVIIGIFYLAQRWVDGMVKRSSEREELIRADATAHVEQAKQHAADYRDTTERMIAAFDRNTSVLTTVVETIRPMSETLVRIDKHLMSGDKAPAKARMGEAL